MKGEAKKFTGSNSFPIQDLRWPPRQSFPNRLCISVQEGMGRQYVAWSSCQPSDLCKGSRPGRRSVRCLSMHSWLCCLTVGGCWRGNWAVFRCSGIHFQVCTWGRCNGRWRSRCKSSLARPGYLRRLRTLSWTTCDEDGICLSCCWTLRRRPPTHSVWTPSNSRLLVGVIELLEKGCWLCLE